MKKLDVNGLGPKLKRFKRELMNDDEAEVKRLSCQDLYRKEKSVQTSVMKYLRTQPGWWVKISDRFVAGIPDIIGCLNGHFFSIELKRPKGERPTALQVHNMEKINQAGGRAVWITSLKEVKDYVKRWKNMVGVK